MHLARPQAVSPFLFCYSAGLFSISCFGWLRIDPAYHTTSRRHISLLPASVSLQKSPWSLVYCHVLSFSLACIARQGRACRHHSSHRINGAHEYIPPSNGPKERMGVERKKDRYRYCSLQAAQSDLVGSMHGTRTAYTDQRPNRTLTTIPILQFIWPYTQYSTQHLH
ncbi:hypothetical protein F4777DRAFT_9851 [Nemania sp. FL0916]|nr:hypothetical protein F4777DRAFT_9851 [Nemania sp. FL0916]